MVPQFQNNLFGSVFLWLEHQLTQKAVAYQTLTTPLYYVPDTQLPAGYIRYSSPFKTWNYDSGVSGAVVIQTVSGASGILLNRSSGMKIDYGNGGIILTSNYGTGLALTGTYSFREVNMYQANETQESLLTQGKFFRNPRFVYAATSGVQPYSYVTPAVFLDTLSSKTEAFQFGGLIDSTVTFTATILAESTFQLNALLSISSDMKYQYLPVFNTIDDVVDGWGDTKPGCYNYNDLVAMWGAPGNLAYVKNVRTAKMSDRVKANPLLFVGMADFEISYVRQAPISTNVFV
jgi:hypothetical protein